MDNISAWEYWFTHKGRIREIMVAEPNEAKARQSIETKFPNATFLSRKAIPVRVTRLLKMQSGEMRESWPADGSEPDPKFGTISMA